METILVKIYLVLRLRYGRNALIYHIFLALSLAPLIGNKISGLVHLSWFGFLGISYLTFRIAQIIIETYDGVITEIKLFEFSCFLLFFPSISSGPIDRSRRFHEDFEAMRPRSEYLDLLGDGLLKLLLDMVYKFVLAALFSKLMIAASTGTIWYAEIGYAYCYGLNMFFDFAGYSLMAVGTSYILGVKAPDNFRLPFINKDIKDFWDRWHISLSHWFRDFIFSRFMITSIKKKWFHTKLTKASVGFTEIYQKKIKFYKKNKQKIWYQILSWFITIQLVMLGFYIFSGRFLEILLH